MLESSGIVPTMEVGGNNNGCGGWSGDWGSWIILFLIFGIFGGNGWGNGFGGFGGGASGVAENYVLATDFATIERKLDTITNGICDSTFALNNTMTNGFASVQQTLSQGFAGLNTAMVQQGYETRLGTQALGSQLASCCCDIKQGIGDINYNIATQANGISRGIETGFANTNYNLATQNCQTLSAIDKVGDRIIDYLANEKAQSLRDENFALKLQASQAQQNNYIVNQLRPATPIPAYQVPNPNCCYNSCGSCGCGSF